MIVLFDMINYYDAKIKKGWKTHVDTFEAW